MAKVIGDRYREAIRLASSDQDYALLEGGPWCGTVVLVKAHAQRIRMPKTPLQEAILYDRTAKHRTIAVKDTGGKLKVANVYQVRKCGE